MAWLLKAVHRSYKSRSRSAAQALQVGPLAPSCLPIQYTCHHDSDHCLQASAGRVVQQTVDRSTQGLAWRKGGVFPCIAIAL